MHKRRVVVLGEIGTGNLGDDFGFALLRDALVKAFVEFGVEAEVVGQGPTAPRDGAHAVVTGCGTLLDQVGYLYVAALVAESYRVPIAVLGTGMTDPCYAKPTAEGDRLLAHVLTTACYAWRRAYDGPDVAWLLGWQGAAAAPGDDAPCAINAGYACHNLLPLATERLREIRARLKRKSVLVAAFKNDLPYLEPLAAKGEQILLVDGSAASLAALAGCSAALCFRVHLGVVAACCGVHPILLNYTRKVREVFERTAVEPSILNAGFSDDFLVALLDGPAPRPAPRAVEVAQYDCRQHVRNAAYYLTHAWGLI